MSTLETSLKLASQGFVSAVSDAISRSRAQGAEPEAIRRDVDRLVRSVDKLCTSLDALASAMMSGGAGVAAPWVGGRRRASRTRSSGDETVAESIVNAVKAYGGGMAISEVAATVGLPLSAVRPAVKRAVVAGKLKMVGSRRFARYYDVNAPGLEEGEMQAAQDLDDGHGEEAAE